MTAQPASDIIPHIKFPRGRVGIFGVGLDAYWPQFAGLKEKVLDSCDRFRTKVAAYGVEIVDGGFVDTTQKSFAAGEDGGFDTGHVGTGRLWIRRWRRLTRNFLIRALAGPQTEGRRRHHRPAELRRVRRGFLSPYRVNPVAHLLRFR